MRRGYKYVEVADDGGARTSVDSSPDEFAETMGYGRATYASREEFLAAHDERWIIELHEVLAELLEPGRTILSIGSGAGEHEARLVEAGYDVVATDLVPGALEDARRLFPGLRTAQFDVFRDEPPVAPDDVLVTGLDFYFDDADTRRLFTRLRELVPIGGRLVFALRYRENPGTWAIDRVCSPALAALRRARGARLARKAHGFRRTERQITAFATAAGFRAARVRRAGFGVELTRLGIVSERAAQLDRRLGLFTAATVFEFLG